MKLAGGERFSSPHSKFCAHDKHLGFVQICRNKFSKVVLQIWLIKKIIVGNQILTTEIFNSSVAEMVN